MNDTLISTLICILSSTTVRCQSPCYEADLIDRLNHFFHFYHNVVLLDSLIDHHRCCVPAKANKIDVFIPQTVYSFDLSNLSNENDSELTISKSVTSENTFVIIVADSERLEFNTKTKLWIQVQAIVHFSKSVKMGVFFVNNKGTSMDIIEQLFSFVSSWQIGIVNIVCTFYSNSSLQSFNVFRFESLGTFRMLNITDNESMQDYFTGNVLIRLVQGKEVISTRVVVKLVMSPILNVTTMPVMYLPQQYDDIKGQINMEITLQEAVLGAGARTYPHRTIPFVVLVPHAQPYQGFVDYLKQTTWKRLFVYTFIVVVVTSLLLTLSEYLRSKKILLIQRTTDVINLLMNDNGSIRYGQLHRADVYIFIPLTFSGLIVVNGIFSVFQSYLTVPIYENQIKTIDNLFKSEVKFLTSEKKVGIIESLDRTIELFENIS